MKKSVKVWGFVVIFAFSLTVALLSSGELVSSAQVATELEGHTLPAEWNYLTTFYCPRAKVHLVRMAEGYQSIMLL